MMNTRLTKKEIQKVGFIGEGKWHIITMEIIIMLM